MATLAIPYTFTPNEVALSSQVDANFTAVQNVVNALDNTNINNAIGLFASNLVPTSGPQATFGGTQVYTFPENISVGGGSILSPAGISFVNTAVSAYVAATALAFQVSVGGYCPPVYTTAGMGLPASTHIVIGSGTVAASSNNVVVTLAGSAIFTVDTYFVVAMCSSSSTLVRVYDVVQTNGSQFTIYLDGNAPAGGQLVNFIAIGT